MAGPQTPTCLLKGNGGRSVFALTRQAVVHASPMPTFNSFSFSNEYIANGSQTS